MKLPWKWLHLRPINKEEKNFFYSDATFWVFFASTHRQ